MFWKRCTCTSKVCQKRPKEADTWLKFHKIWHLTAWVKNRFARLTLLMSEIPQFLLNFWTCTQLFMSLVNVLYSANRKTIFSRSILFLLVYLSLQTIHIQLNYILVLYIKTTNQPCKMFSSKHVIEPFFMPFHLVQFFFTELANELCVMIDLFLIIPAIFDIHTKPVV